MLNHHAAVRPAAPSGADHAGRTDPRAAFAKAGWVVIASVGLLSLAACSDAEPQSVSSAGVTAEDTTNSSEPNGTDQARVPAERATTSIPDETPTAASPTDGTKFTDPDGTYEISIPSHWQADHGAFVAEVEMWVVAEPQDSFAPNVNLLTQTVHGLDLAAYLDLSVENAPLFLDDFELVDKAIVEGDAGQALAVMEYTDGDLQFLGVFAPGTDEVVVATLTAPIDRFSVLRDEVLPFLLTLKAT